MKWERPALIGSERQERRPCARRGPAGPWHTGRRLASQILLKQIRARACFRARKDLRAFDSRGEDGKDGAAARAMPEPTVVREREELMRETLRGGVAVPNAPANSC